MFRQIILLSSKNSEVINLALDLARQPDSHLIVLALIDPKRIIQRTQDTGRKESNVREEMESKAWQELYQFENDFKKSGIKVTISLEEASLFELHPFLKSIKADLLVVPIEHLRYYNYKLTEEFLTQLPCPILVLGRP